MKRIILAALLTAAAVSGCGPAPEPLTDSEDPSISLSSPADGSVHSLGQPITLSGSAADDTGIEGIYLVVNGGSPQRISTRAVFQYLLNTGAAGVYELSLYARDTAGNSSPSVMRVVQVTNGSESAYSAGSLLINEVGATYWANSSAWFELYNNTNVSLDLSEFIIASSTITRVSPYTVSFERTYFSLPAVSLAPGGYILIRGESASGADDGPGVVHIGKTDRLPFWLDRGFVEVLSLGRTIDFVRFGSVTVTPLSGSFSGSATALPYSEDAYGNSLSRDSGSADSDSSSDWYSRSFATAGGVNDITSSTDSDNDGIPDQAEVPGGTFAGLPLYDWGARVGVRDIFVHIDYMDSTDPGVIPREEALIRVRAAFTNSGEFTIHIDAGDLFVSGTDASRFNLDDSSHRVPAAAGISLGEISGRANLYDYKNAYLDIRKRQVFHYCLFAISQVPGNTNGSSGLAELKGNDLIVSLGNWNLSTNTSSQSYELINWQASTLMHELGHNLGLRHGGYEDNNYKPNYYSIMNYAYQLYGLPVIGSPAEGDRYYLKNGTLGYTSRSQLTNGPATPGFSLDYSWGQGSGLNEAALNEAEGLRQPGSSGVDWNADGDTSDSGLSRQLSDDGQSSILQDYNDWANLYLFFFRYWQGDNNGVSLLSIPSQPVVWEDPLVSDQQPYIIETLTRP